MNARDGAVRRASLLGGELALDDGDGVLLERNPRISALLRTVMHQAIFANVQVAGSCAAAPAVRLTLGDIVLEPVEARIVTLLQLLHGEKNFALIVVQWTKLAAAIVDDPDSRCETQLYRASSHHQRIVRIFNAAADDGIDVHVKVGMVGQQLQLLVENLE